LFPVLKHVLLMLGIRLKIDANDVVSLEFVGHGAIAKARDHGSHRVTLLHEVLGADRIIETLANGNVTELDAVKAWM
jgi:hypothetical protein